MAGGWLAAIAGFAFHYYHSKIQEERKARIERVNVQLRDFYGPLLACVTATKSAFTAMVRQHGSQETSASFQAAILEDPEGKAAGAYRLWMKEVLQPLNEKAASIITDHINLLEGSTIEPQLLQLVAHVYANRVILERWSQGDMKAFSALSYPDKLEEYVRKEFAKLKRKQAELLGTSIKPATSKL